MNYLAIMVRYLGLIHHYKFNKIYLKVVPCNNNLSNVFVNNHTYVVELAFGRGRMNVFKLLKLKGLVIMVHC